MLVIIILPLGLFILLEIFLYINKTMDKAPIWLLIDISLFTILLIYHFFNLLEEIPNYFWIVIIIWIIIHIFIIRQIFERKKIY